MIESETDTGREVRGGFTLTEILISTGLGMLLLVVVLGVVGAGGDGFNHSKRRIDVNVESRAALSALADDIHSMRWDNLNAGIRTEQGTWPSEELWFLTLKPRSAQESGKSAGDLCFVHYYTRVTRELEGESGPFSRKLYRRLVSSSEVMKNLRERGDHYASPLADPGRPEDEAIAFNVVQFTVKARIYDGDRVVDWVPTEDGVPIPDFFEVTLAVSDDQTAALLEEAGDWETGSERSLRFFGTPGDEGESQRLRRFHVIISARE